MTRYGPCHWVSVSTDPQTWNRFVHFKAVEGDGPHLSKIHWGEPVDPNIDAGLAMLQDPPIAVKVRVWSESQIFDPKDHFTGEILTIDRLMSPIVIQGTPRSVLVNYQDRAVRNTAPLVEV